MKASLVAYDFRELQKKSELIWIWHRVPKIARDPNMVAGNFRTK
jgi:hypothetical protein